MEVTSANRGSLAASLAMRKSLGASAAASAGGGGGGEDDGNIKSRPNSIRHTHHIRPRRRYVIATASFAIFLTLTLLFATRAPAELFPVMGGVVGFIASSFVMGAYIYKKKDRGPPLALLFWRAFCDLGLSLRFLNTHSFNVLICHMSTCTIAESLPDQYLCSFPSALFEFFEIASEAWFLCIAIDLHVTISNPFSSFKDREKYYHMFAWTAALFFSLTTGLSTSISGFWYIEGSKGIAVDRVFCWLQIEDRRDGTLSWKPWCMFYVPLLFVYSFSVYSLYNAYDRLKRGISATFMHRLRVLVINAINISACIIYWFILLVLYGSVFAAANSNLDTAASLFNLLMFVIPSKGVSAVLVWVLVTSLNIDAMEEKEEDIQLDLNGALRKEVLIYAADGIRRCCHRATSEGMKSPEAFKEKEKISSYLTNAVTNQPEEAFSPWEFCRLILGVQDQVDKVATKIKKKERRVSAQLTRQSMSIASRGGSALLVNGTLPMLAASSDEAANNLGIGEDGTRFSQRPTVQTSNHISAPSLFTGKGNTASTTDIHKRVEDRQLQLHHEGTILDDVNDANNMSRSMGERDTDASTFEMSNFKSNNNYYSYYNNNKPSSSVLAEGIKEDIINTEESDLTFCGRFSSFMYSTFCSSASQAELANRVEFTEFRPYDFRRIRLAAGLTDDVYDKLFTDRIKERLTQGGASGAFFFFSKDEVLIAKSCTEEEADNLRANARAYADYMTENPKSLISKIYGAYRLRIYGTALHFFVMNNIFLNDNNHKTLEKYDLKGSTVARNATVPQNGEKVTCRLCEQKFVFKKPTKKDKSRKIRSATTMDRPNSRTLRTMSTASTVSDIEAGDGDDVISPLPAGLGLPRTLTSDSQDSVEEEIDRDICTKAIGGQHQPLVINKDNDLKIKLKLPSDAARELIDQLDRDSRFLLSIEVMDYSLLMGVHYTDYDRILDPAIGAQAAGTAAGGTGTGGEVESEEARRLKRGSAVISSTSLKLDDAATTTSALSDELKGQFNKPFDVSRISGPDCYYMGIIDFQQRWTFSKQIERLVKIYFKGADPDGLSAIEPTRYQERFIYHMQELLELDGDVPGLERHPSITTRVAR